jgi:hypothetical protein
MEKEGPSDLARAYQSTPEKKVGDPVAPSLGPLSPITPFPKHVLVQAGAEVVRLKQSLAMAQSDLEVPAYNGRNSSTSFHF